MHILPPRIIWIYPPATVTYTSSTPRRGTAPPPDIQEGMDSLADMADAEKNPEIKKKLNTLKNVVNALVAKILQIPSSGIRDMLFTKLQDIMKMAGRGELDAAIASADVLMSLVDKCADLCDKILKNVSRLRTSLSVQGPAGIILRAIGDAALLAMNGAASEAALETIADLTDKAVMIGKKLEGVKPGSEEYAQLMDNLIGILSDLMAMDQRSDTTIVEGTVPDVKGTLRKIGGGMQDLRGATAAAGDQPKLDGLEAQLYDMVMAGLGAGIPMAELEKQVDDVMRQAKGGDLEGAQTMAESYGLAFKQMKAINTHLDKRMDLLTREAGRLKGPEADMAKKLLAGLGEARANARTPQELHELDQAIGEVMDAVCGCAAKPGGRSPSYQVLVRLTKELGTSSGGPGKPGSKPGSPGFGRDTALPSRPGVPGRPPGGPGGILPPSTGGPSDPAGPGWGGPSAGEHGEDGGGDNGGGPGWGGPSAGPARPTVPAPRPPARPAVPPPPPRAVVPPPPPAPPAADGSSGPGWGGPSAGEHEPDAAPDADSGSDTSSAGPGWGGDSATSSAGPGWGGDSAAITQVAPK